MGSCKLTHKAKSEIEGIYEYSILNFGWATAKDYISSLEEKFQVLADNQSWGNDYSFIKAGLRRYEHRSHSIYYQLRGKNIVIVRVLGNRQDPAWHF